MNSITVRSLALVCSSAGSISLSEPYFIQSQSWAQSYHSKYFPPPSHFWPLLAISRLFKAIQDYSRLFKALPGNTRVFQAIPPYSSPFQHIPVYLDQFLISHHWPWLSISEGLCLDGCFPMEPKALCKLTVLSTIQGMGTFKSWLWPCVRNMTSEIKHDKLNFLICYRHSNYITATVS